MPASSSGHSRTDSAAVAMSNCRAGAECATRDPNTRPLRAEPVANSAITKVAAPGASRSAVNATATTSITAKTTPIATIIAMIASNAGKRSSLTPGVSAAVPMHRRFGLSQPREGEGSDEQQDRREQRAGFGEHRHPEPHRQHRADDETHLVDHRFERERRPEPGRTAVQLGPSCADHRADRGHQARGERTHEQQRDGSLEAHAREHCDDRRGADDRGSGQYPPLPVPVHGP